MPYKFAEIGTEPKQLILRRGDVINWIGVRSNEFDKIVKAGILPWKRLRPGGVRVFSKADVKRVFLEGFKCHQISEQQLAA